LDAAASYGEQWNFAEESSKKIDQMITRFAHESQSALLRRKAESIVEAKKNGIMHSQLDPLSPEVSLMLSISEKLSQEEIDRRMQAQRDYATLMDPGVVHAIEQDYGLSFKKLSVREQIWFVGVLRDLSIDDEKRIMSFTKRYGINGARSFLSAELGDEFREVVLTIGEKLPEAQARFVFERYSEIAQVAQHEAEELVEDFFQDGTHNNVSVATIEAELLKRAARMLKEVATKAGDEDISQEELETQLGRYKKDVVVFSSIFRAAFKEGKYDLEDVRGLSLDTVTPSEIDGDAKTKMVEIFESNWRAQKPEVADFLVGAFGSILEKDDDSTEFSVLEKDGEVIAFVRFDKRPDLGEDVLYAGSLNVDTRLRGSAIGEALMAATIDKQAETHTLQADFFPELQVGTRYVEDMG